MKVSALKPNPDNPRVIKDDSFKKLCNSIQEFPKMMALRPIVVDQNNVVLGGNMRLRAIQHLGFKEIPDEWVKHAADLTEEEQRRFIIADNVSGGEWDIEALQNGWDTDQLSEWGLEIDWPVIEHEATEDDYEIPDTIETDIVLGDLFEIGEHRLLCGDSTDSDQVAKLMNGEKADMVFTDPPYGVSYEGGLNEKKKQQIKNDSLRGDTLYEFLYDVFTNLKLSTKGKSALYIFYAHSNTMQFINAFYDVGLKQRSIIIWYKQGGGFGDFMAQYMNAYEPCIYGSNGESVNWYGPTNEKTIWEIDKEKKCDLHPTMKPISLVARALKNSSKQGDAVLDLFGGSGSTLIACEQLNRTCYMMELDPKYCQVIIDRMQKLDPTLKILRNGEEYTQTKINEIAEV